MEEPSWKQTKLSLERPYKDDSGKPIPVLFDILPDGQRVHEPRVNARKALGDNLRRIFLERGTDFFDKTQGRNISEGPLSALTGDVPEPIERQKGQDYAPTQLMTAEELYKMRSEVLPQLFISLGEMTHARDLLVSLLASTQPLSSGQVPAPTKSDLSASIVSKPPPIVSVQAFNAQLTIGSKDEALRKAANVFKTAASNIERTRVKDEKYWVDALKVRRGNWGLIPAPLPFGTATGKGADRTAKDFLVSFGLEESLILYRRQAIASFSSHETTNVLTFPGRRHARLRISLTVTDAGGSLSTSHNTKNCVDTETLEGALKEAQQEIVEREIFSLLVQEAGNLSTASARVSERLIVIDAADAIELRFELVHDKEATSALNQVDEEKCNIIYFVLHALLLCRHTSSKAKRLEMAGTVSNSELSHPPSILQPIIDALQFKVFCDRVKAEIDQAISSLSIVGISSTLRFNAIGETGEQLVHMLLRSGIKSIGGQAILKIDHQHNIRFTFVSPSSLTAHLPQATLPISSLPQLYQLLTDEVERCILQKICILGTKLCDRVGGTWFVDLNRCVGRWEGCVLEKFAIDCTAFQLHKMTPKHGQIATYSSDSRNLSLLSWVEDVIMQAHLTA